MAVCTLAPNLFPQFGDNNFNPLAAGQIYSYLAGSTTPLATYKDAAGTVPHSNPIILDSAGRVPGGAIFLSVSSYKFVLADATATIIATIDNVASSRLFNEAVVLAGGAYSANGGPQCLTGVATTLFAVPAAVAARYEIAAAVNALGVNYISYATVASDGTVARIVANNGANLALTLSGLNVQANQSSGSTQLVIFNYLRIG